MNNLLFVLAQPLDFVCGGAEHTADTLDVVRGQSSRIFFPRLNVIRQRPHSIKVDLLFTHDLFSSNHRAQIPFSTRYIFSISERFIILLLGAIAPLLQQHLAATFALAFRHVVVRIILLLVGWN
jgi:hypothetical protein